ncbi:hypothetical protein [Propioniciclava soli]|uniref:Uncharacterized protein n=1 Tax=Propioniciclava soli TaxID=2775081 RepID=A0ABZ3C7A5_9ACTN|nr:hypothetical protein [Propioniciclava soli]
MAEIIDMQNNDPDVPDEEKDSYVSYFACRNSHQSQALCWRY